ncbi:MAG: MBL fold metallo-hydrolase [Mogibacterium sp.]|nr:MBL fold metallo-hydrolase [Mogibacterium sp.]
MRVTHIYHSGFLVELPHMVLIFDWYTGELPAFDAGKPLFVFVSHRHGDHYGECIWSLAERFESVTYIIDREVPYRMHQDVPGVCRVRHGGCYDLPVPGMDATIIVRTLKSTDTGVAFCVEADGYRIFHAGDLNVWWWDDEPEEDNLNQDRNCRGQLELLREQLCGEQIDICFWPLDPRLGENAPRGLAQFAEVLGARWFVPMHYWDRKEESLAYQTDPRLAEIRERLRYEDRFDIE